MSLCDDCPFEEKLLLCCPRFPETGGQTVLVINGERLGACPHLDGDGHCRIYDSRPRGCRDFECDRLRNGEKASGFRRFFRGMM
jgi:Fe-S-cluster containining protein